MRKIPLTSLVLIVATLGVCAEAQLVAKVENALGDAFPVIHDADDAAIITFLESRLATAQN